jgi:tetratricopeptide (TPR) repeat protein
MMMKRITATVFVIFFYFVVFTRQEYTFSQQLPYLKSALPAVFYNLTSGFLRQIIAETLFVKTSVFLGGVPPKTPVSSYTQALGNNFQTITSIYPEFIDPYYFSQAFLAAEDAKTTNEILEKGIVVHPEEHLFPFFAGYNYLRYLNDPLKAAAIYKNAAASPGAPPVFQRLAVLMTVRGGDIISGMISLRAMIATEQDPQIQDNYKEEIEILERAYSVEKALQSYAAKYNDYPQALIAIVPEFIDKIPEIGGKFILEYQYPTLRLRTLTPSEIRERTAPLLKFGSENKKNEE